MFTELDTQLGVDSEDQTDERVYCNIPIGGGLYAGYILGLTSNQLFGTASDDYGVYTAASFGGTRLNVLSAGTPGNGDVLFNPLTGRIVANQVRTVYVTYPFFGRLFRWWEYGPLTLAYPHLSLTSASGAMVIYPRTCAYAEGFVGCVINVLTAGSADVIFDIKRDDVVVETITLPSGLTTVYELFSARIKFWAGSVLTIEVRENTAAADGLFLELLRG